MTEDDEPPVNDNLSEMARQVKPAMQALNMAAMVFAAWGHSSGRKIDPVEPERQPEPVEKKGTA
jgi:hypothetical protein